MELLNQTQQLPVSVAGPLTQVPKNIPDNASLQCAPLSTSLSVIDAVDASSPIPTSPINDIFLCPPLTNQPFTPRNFDTPEEEEAWWNNPLTWPGDHLVAPPDRPLTCSLYETPEPRSYIVCFSSDDEDVTPLTAGAPVAPCALRPASSLSSADGDCSDVDTDSESESNISEASNDTNGGSDEYLPAQPSHRARPGPARRPASASITLSTSYRRVYKPRTTKHKVLLEDKHQAMKTPISQKSRILRREFIEISATELQKLRNEQNILKESGQEAQSLEVQHPIPHGEGKNRKWRCAYVKNGVQCPVYSGRSGEGMRHTMTHLNVRFLCGNPTCTLVFSRQDPVKRHIKMSDCKRNLGPGVTVDSPKDAVIMDGQNIRLVNLVWIGRPLSEGNPAKISHKDRRRSKFPKKRRNSTNII